MLPREGLWPTTDQLQIDCDLDELQVDVSQLAGSMSPLLGVVEGERLQLNVLALSEIPAAEPLLEVWGSLLLSACQKEEFERDLTGGEILAACHSDRTLFPCIVAILMKDPWPECQGSGLIGGQFWIRLSDDVLAVREAASLAEILEIRGPAESRPLLGPDFSAFF